MDNEIKKQSYKFIGICIVVSATIIGGSIMLSSRLKPTGGEALSAKALAKLEQTITPNQGITLPAIWGDLGKHLVENGVIDQKKFDDLYAQRGGLDEKTGNLLTGNNNEKLVITKENANIMLNLLWALGLGNKNEILEKGEMADPQYGGADKFASTGGWTLASSNPMGHYSRHPMISLTPEQQLLVENVSKNIYRPCCGNSTHFPDCNHGMAMLGLLELMASRGVSEADMYKAALAVNAYWFPSNYLTLASYFKSKGTDWSKVDPKLALSAEYSSGQGYQKLLQQI